MISVKFPSFGKLSKIHGIFDGWFKYIEKRRRNK